jgi:hypothetical protein
MAASSLLSGVPGLEREFRRLRALDAGELLVKASDPSLTEMVRHGLPRRGLAPEVTDWRRRNIPHLWRGARRVLTARALGLPTVYGALWLRKTTVEGEEIDLGLASLRLITAAGMNYQVDAFQGLATLGNFRYHALGTGTNGESPSDTALQAELTTAYTTDNTRATGTQGEGASANIYRSTASILVDASVAVTEHGVFSTATSGTGTLLDRSVFAAENLASGAGLTPAWEYTATPGS